MSDVLSKVRDAKRRILTAMADPEAPEEAAEVARVLRRLLSETTRDRTSLYQFLEGEDGPVIAAVVWASLALAVASLRERQEEWSAGRLVATSHAVRPVRR